MSADLLVTGAAGLLGSAVLRRCPAAQGVTRRDADLTDAAATRRLFETHRPKRVLHLAALVGGVRFNLDHDTELLDTNRRINANVLAAAADTGVERLISVLSGCAFHFRDGESASEADLHAGPPHEGSRGFAAAKRLLDLDTRRFARERGCRFSTITPVTMYGPGDCGDSERGHVVAPLLHRACLARDQGQPLSVWGTGRAVRQFVFVDDVARLLLAELEQPDAACGPETMIIAPDAGLTINALARTIASTVGFRGPIAFTGTWEGQLVKRLHSTRFEDRHRGFHFTPLAEGLAISYRYVRDRGPAAGAP